MAIVIICAVVGGLAVLGSMWRFEDDWLRRVAGFLIGAFAGVCVGVYIGFNFSF